MRAQGVDVRLLDLRREVRQLDGEVAERPLARGKIGPPVVVRDVLGEVVCGALCTEVVGVSLGSVVAALLGGGDRREELALATGESRLAEHDLAVQIHRRAEHAGPEAHCLEDVEDLPSALDRGVVLLREQAFRIGLVDELDVGPRQTSPSYRVCGNPRSTLLVAGSGQRLVTAFVRV